MTLTRVGILGGGQLARLLAEAARALGLDPRVLTASAADPAAQVCPPVLGSLQDPGALARFAEGLDLVTFENEFLDCDRLETIPTAFQPSVAVLRRLQDKLTQKQILGETAVPTAPWMALDEPDFEEAWRRFPSGMVLKWSRMGYDGKGILDLPRRDDGRARTFWEAGRKAGAVIYAEERIAFTRELALVASRSVSGEFAAYPLVRSLQTSGICYLVTGPATTLGNPERQEAEATGYARLIAESLGYVGTLAIELFETAEGRLLVNEIAPRVHNSGHCTLDSSPASQFENHWRALLGMPLGPTRGAPAFAMLNLLGPAGVSLSTEDPPLPPAPEGARLYWYGKREIRPGRKLGHLNGTATDAASLDKLVERLRAWEGTWAAGLRASGKINPVSEGEMK